MYCHVGDVTRIRSVTAYPSAERLLGPISLVACIAGLTYGVLGSIGQCDVDIGRVILPAAELSHVAEPAPHLTVGPDLSDVCHANRINPPFQSEIRRLRARLV